MLLSLGAIFSAALYSLGNCSAVLGGLQNQKDQTAKAHIFVMRIWLRHLDVCLYVLLSNQNTWDADLKELM